MGARVPQSRSTDSTSSGWSSNKWHAPIQPRTNGGVERVKTSGAPRNPHALRRTTGDDGEHQSEAPDHEAWVELMRTLERCDAFIMPMPPESRPTWRGVSVGQGWVSPDRCSRGLDRLVQQREVIPARPTRAPRRFDPAADQMSSARVGNQALRRGFGFIGDIRTVQRHV